MPAAMPAANGGPPPSGLHGPTCPKGLPSGPHRAATWPPPVNPTARPPNRLPPCGRCDTLRCKLFHATSSRQRKTTIREFGRRPGGALRANNLSRYVGHNTREAGAEDTEIDKPWRAAPPRQADLLGRELFPTNSRHCDNDKTVVAKRTPLQVTSQEKLQRGGIPNAPSAHNCRPKSEI